MLRPVAWTGCWYPDEDRRPSRRLAYDQWTVRLKEFAADANENASRRYAMQMRAT